MSTPVQNRSPGRARRRDRHELLVDREYAASRDEVLRTVRAKLQAAGVELDDGDLEAAYNQAWHALYLMLADGERIDNRIAMLVTITHRRALDDHRAQRVDRRTELDPALPAPRPDVERRLDEQRQLRALRSGMRERLSGRELQAATLCYLHQRSRPEAAEIMGLSPRRMEKIMDRVSKRFGALVRDVQGDWCATQDSLIKAYALGILAPDGERHQLAVDHLADCPSCRRRVLGLRGLAAVAPPLPLMLGGAGLAGGGAAAGSDRAGDSGAAGAGGAASGTAGASAVTAAATAGAGAGGTGAAGSATAGGTAGVRGAGRLLGRGSTRSNLVAAAAVTATIAAAATAIALTSGGSDPRGVATEAGPSTGDGRGSGADPGAASGPGSGRNAAPDRSAAAAEDPPDRPTKNARGTRSSGRTTTAERSTRTTGTRSDARTGPSNQTGTSASPPSRSPASSGGTSTGGTPSTVSQTPPATAPVRPSAPDANAPTSGTGSTTTAPAKVPPKVVEDGAEEFELH